MAKRNWGMVIDLHRCVGCAACDIACKTENNVPVGFHWSNHIIETRGTFPDTKYRYVPTLCNHCANAPCVNNCPTTAMHKSKDGVTLHDANLCIGCRACQTSCPYGAIYFNDDRPHKQLREDKTPAIAGCTATGKEVIEKSGAALPYYNPAREATYEGIRFRGIVEKCTMCDHRLAEKQQPWCVESCPTGARIFGDLNDSASPPRRALAKHSHRVLQKDKGTKPKVYYIREFS
ncbi:MAG: 4Fe-4S dicluster domain-containing protein [Planctomycetota bacterium]|jgi:molybdopterin-containing oxidoreductase family iron-sulfur binding subunit